MNKAMRSIHDALVEGRTLRLGGRRWDSGCYGTRYEVTVYGEVYYWGSRVAHVGKKACTVDLCGWPTPTTRRVINAALDAFSELTGRKHPRVYQHRNEQWLGDEIWDGSKRTIR